MAFIWLDSVKGLFTSELIRKAASALGEGEGNTAKAISGIVPSVLGGIISKGTSGIDGASSILNMAKGVEGAGILNNLGNLFGGGSNPQLSNGLDMVKRLLGDKLNSIAGTISGFADIKESSVPSLMGMVTPMALGVLGQHASQNNLTPKSLSNMLASQKSSVAEALPPGLDSLAGLTGLSSVGGAITSMTGGVEHAAVSTVHTAAYEIEKTGSNKRWLWPMMLALLVIFLVLVFSRSCTR